MKKIIAALISLTLFYSSTVCIFAIENQECPYYEEITDVIELKKGPVLYLNEKRNDTYWGATRSIVKSYGMRTC